MRVPGLALAVVLMLSAPARAATCGPGDAPAIAAARAAIETQCPCAASPTHGEYVRCAKAVLKALVTQSALPASCRNSVARCASKSTCGSPGKATCCRTGPNRTVCSVKDPAVCLARGGCVGAVPSCCDACGPGGCNPPPATTSTTSTTSTTTTVPPGLCGNGAVDPGEQCDGQAPYCVDCHIEVSGCCEFVAGPVVCSVPTPVFGMPPVLCAQQGGTFSYGRSPASSAPCPLQPVLSNGPCVDTPIAPTSLCCQLTPTTCSATPVASTGDLTSALMSCVFSTGGTAAFGLGTCSAGTCVPGG